MVCTNLGLGFHYAKFVTSLVVLLITLICVILIIGAAGGAAAGAARESSAGFILYVVYVLNICRIVSLLLPLLGVTGSILCCFVPAKSGAKPFIIISLALDGAAFLMNVVALLVGGAGAFRGGGGQGVNAMMGTAGLLGFMAFVLFMFFLRKLAYYFGEDRIAEEAMSIIIHLFMLIGAVFVGGVLLGPLIVFVPVLAVAAMIFAALALVVVWINLALRIVEVIGSLRQYMRTRLGV
jgi:hypothetical protein